MKKKIIRSRITAFLFSILFFLTSVFPSSAQIEEPFPTGKQIEQADDKTGISLTTEELRETAAMIKADTSPDLGITAKAAILMEADTGTVIYEKNSTEQLSPASITKIMTLILIFDAITTGQITLQDEVTTSAYAKSMGGSQVFLEEGEKQTVETLIKCIVVASGNDASVAMAEYISGSETEFVRQMNERAAGLGMTETHFEDCCGLTESATHLTSAKDVALMSRELITKYPQIHQYSSIWMENITHVTEKGSSEFGLANTNKLLKQYEYCNGLKTGSTSIAKYCLSATATKDGISLIAVVMAAPDYKVRFSEAKAMLTYGYGVCRLFTDENTDELPSLSVEGGVKEEIGLRYQKGFSYLSTDGTDVTQIQKKIELPETCKAPVVDGQVAGRAVYSLNGAEIGSVDILYDGGVEKAGYWDYFRKLLDIYLI